jgi:type 1 glutamine amidotransferase
MSRALIVRGGWDGHQPVETTNLFAHFLQENGFEVQIEESSKVYANASVMDDIDLIVQANTMNSIEQDELKGLVSAVTSGAGLAGWHGGIADSYRNSPSYLHMIGGQFAHHPAVSPELRRGEQSDNYIPYKINIVPDRRSHPIVESIDDFDLITEQYWVLTDSLSDVLATTTIAAREFDSWHQPVTCPAVWTRQWGKGRVFVSTPGHRLEVVENPSVRTIIERGLLWASR